MKRSTHISPEDLRGITGLRARAKDELLASQPKTVLEALRIPDVGRGATRELLVRGCLVDPEGVQNRSLTRQEFEVSFRLQAANRMRIGSGKCNQR
jgi:hypothetical protein